jgi:hypothetical protein
LIFIPGRIEGIIKAEPAASKIPAREFMIFYEFVIELPGVNTMWRWNWKEAMGKWT